MVKTLIQKPLWSFPRSHDLRVFLWGEKQFSEGLQTGSRPIPSGGGQLDLADQYPHGKSLEEPTLKSQICLMILGTGVKTGQASGDKKTQSAPVFRPL